MLRLTKCAVLVVALTAFGSQTFAHHSLEHIETRLDEADPHATLVKEAAPDFSLRDVEGETVTLSELSGQVVVLNFVDSRAVENDSAHMELIGQLQSMVNGAGMAEHATFITVATDVDEGDKAQRLKQSYSEDYMLDSGNWQLLYSEDDAAELIEAFGLKAGEDGDYKLSANADEAMTFVIDKNGQLGARFESVTFAPVNLVTYVNALVYE